MKKLIFKFFLVYTFVFAQNLQSAEFQGKFKQGSFILGKTEPNAIVFIDNKKVRVSNDGYFVFGIGRDRKNNIIIKIDNNKKIQVFNKKILKRKYKIQRIDGLPKKQVTPPKEVFDRIKKDNVIIAKARSVNSSLNFFKNKFVKKVLKREYKIQRIDGLPEKKVTPPKEVYDRIRKENKLIGKARAVDTDLIYFKDKFITPVDDAIITGVYGSQRILNGKPRRPHYGLDYAASEGTPIKAMMDGIVTLAEKDLYFTGGTIILDHGHGISTLYMHLKDLNVKKNQKIKQEEIIGTVGKTGRSTGPHLDIRLNWFDVKLDPESVLN